MTILESVLALTLLAAATSAVVQFTAATAQWSRRTQRAQLIGEQLADLAERASVLPWEQLKVERLRELPLSKLVTQEFPEGTLNVELSESETSPAAQRITFVYRGSPETPESRLTLWRFAPEAAP